MHSSYHIERWSDKNTGLSVQIEQSGPLLSHQIADAKQQLGTLLISDAGHLELLSIPPDRRSLADEVRICMHDGLAQLKKENEALRLSAQVCATCAITTTWQLADISCLINDHVCEGV